MKTRAFLILSVIIQLHNNLHAQTDTLKEYLVEKDKIFRFSGNTELSKIKFSIRYPSSWETKESDMPHIIQKFIATDLEGKPSFSVTIKKNSGTATFTKEDVDFAYRNLSKLLPHGAEVIATRLNIYLQGERAASIDYIMSTKAENTITGEDVQVYISSYSLMWKNYLIQITCAVNQKKLDSQKLKKLFKHYKSFFESAVNSFILVSKWE